MAERGEMIDGIVSGVNVDRTGLLLSFVNLMVVAACVYLIFRTVFIGQTITGSFGFILSVSLLLGEAFVMFHSVAYCVDFVYACRKKPLPNVDILDWDDAPGVAILMPARHEPYEVLERTLICLQNLDYPNKTIYFLDDSSDEQYMREAEELALIYGARLFHRSERHGAKAGVINDCLKNIEDKYIVVFDADQNPSPAFLKTLVPVIEANPQLAFVQTPQFYTNTDISPIAFGANLQHCMFYEYICEGKSERGAMILCGTNAIIRRQALIDVGGLDESSITEDFSTSINWHSNGWQSLYSSQASVYGEGPTTLLPYMKQQWRWARGNLGVLKKIIRIAFTKPFSMTLTQWWEHFATGSYYLIGWAYFLLMLCPLSYILLRTPSFFMKPEIYLLTFIPYFALSFTIFFTSMRKRNYHPGQLLIGVLLGFISFPVYMKAAIAALFGIRSGFQVTDKTKNPEVTPYRFIWPQITMWLIHFIALVWGANRLVYEYDISVLMSMIWVLYHFLMLSSVFYFRHSGTAENNIEKEINR